MVSTAVAVCLAACALVSPASAAVSDCSTSVYGTSLVITSVRDMSCAQAAADQRRSRQCCLPRFRSAGGFRCSISINRGLYAAQFRCVRGSRAYRFEYSE